MKNFVLRVERKLLLHIQIEAESMEHALEKYENDQYSEENEEVVDASDIGEIFIDEVEGARKI